MGKKDKTTDSLQRTVIIVGLIGSILTTVISMGKEITGVAKEWIVSDNKAEVSKLHEQITDLSNKLIAQDEKYQKLNKEMEKIRAEMENNYVLALAHKLSKSRIDKNGDIVTTSPDIKGLQQPQQQQQQTTSVAYQAEDKPLIQIGWITGIAGIIGWVVFGLWYFIHKKKEVVEEN